LLVANLGPAGLGYSVNRGALNVVVAAAGLAILGVLLFPWRRYDRNLFVVAALSGMCLIALASTSPEDGKAPSSRSTSSW